MQFGKHIGKGLWAFADKALPAVYGIGFIFLVIRVLPEREYGAFAIIQSIFLIGSSMGFSLALQPLTKFAAETRQNGPYIVASLTLITVFFGLVSVAGLLCKGFLAPLLDPSNQGNVSRLFDYLPLLFAATLYRSFAVSLLQAEYKVQRIFWIDSVYFLGTLALFYIAQQLHQFNTAEDLVKLNAVGLVISSGVAFALTYRQLKIEVEFQAEAFRRMWDFGKYNLGSNANYLVYSQMDVFFVSSYAGVVGLAHYSAAKIITRIFDMLSQVSQMFIMPLASKYYALGEKRTLGIIMEKSISFSMLLFLPVFLGILIFPHFILKLLYAGKYDSAAAILQAFGFLALIVPWTSVLASALVGIGRVKEGFFLGLFITGASFVAYWGLIRIGGAFGVAVALVLANLVSVFGLLRLVHRDVEFNAFNVVTRVKDVWVFVKEYVPASLRQ